jgi:hypothetical protein
VRFVVPPLGHLGCVCLEGGVTNTHGDHALALRGIILVRPVAQVLDGGFAAARAKMLACRPRLHAANNNDEASRHPFTRGPF